MTRNNPVLLLREGKSEEMAIDGETYFPSAAVPAFREFSLVI